MTRTAGAASAVGGGFGGGGRRRWRVRRLRRRRWATDFPDSDLNFSFRLQQLTSLKVNPDRSRMRLTDDGSLTTRSSTSSSRGACLSRRKKAPQLRHTCSTAAS